MNFFFSYYEIQFIIVLNFLLFLQLCLNNLKIFYFNIFFVNQ